MPMEGGDARLGAGRATDETDPDDGPEARFRAAIMAVIDATIGTPSAKAKRSGA